MQAIVVLAALAGSVAAQTINPSATPSSVVSATGAAPSGCSANYNGLFQIQVVNATSASSKKMVKRQDMSSDDGGQLIVGLKNSILTSTRNATAYVAGGNHQFQFTTPSQNAQPQPGFIYDAGFTACSNGTIAHGGSAIFYECNGGARNIIADINIYGPAVCYPIFLQIVPYSSGSSAPSSTATVTGTTGVPATSVAPAGASTATPATQSPDGQPGPGSSAVVKTSSVAIVSQISDNQPQAPKTASAVMTSSPVAVLTQISDNQPQAPTPKPSAILTQISDNQPQAPTPAKTPYGTPTRQPVQYTGAANSLNGGSFFGLAAGAAALALL